MMSSAPIKSDRFAPVEDISQSLQASPPPHADSPSPVRSRDLRARTRFLHFKVADPAAAAAAASAVVPRRVRSRDTDILGSLTIVHGPGTGRVFDMDKQVVQIGRDDGQDVQLDFGDTAISRQCHASIAYYGPESGFAVRDGLKPNPVLVNGSTLNGEGVLRDGDLIRIGETTLRFHAA